MKIFTISFAVLIFLYLPIHAKVWQVDTDGEYKFCSELSSLVSDGDTIEIESGEYNNDQQVTWRNDNLFIKGVNGRPVLRAGSKIAGDNSNGKGIFVIKGNNTLVENIEFRNSKVQDNNGAGVRQEGSNLTIRHCKFDGNEMGILQGGTISNCTILVEFCEFLNNGSPLNPGFQHNIYINHIDTLIFRYNFTKNAAAEGHELKSRASNNFITYNRIANINSKDSRNIDMPNGGTAVIVGNIIEQGENSANSNIIGFGMEGLSNPGPHNLWICSNTIVNKKSKGSFVQVADIDTLLMRNNIFVGAKTGGFLIGTPSVLDSSHNFINDDISTAGFVDSDGFDFHLLESSPLIDAGEAIQLMVKGHSLIPALEYVPELNFKARTIDNKIDIGAYEFKKPESVEYQTSGEINIHPNPASEYIEVNLNGGDDFLAPQFNMKIFNFYGKCVMKQEQNQYHNGHVRVDVSGLPTGVFTLVLTCKNRLRPIVRIGKLVLIK